LIKIVRTVYFNDRSVFKVLDECFVNIGIDG